MDYVMTVVMFLSFQEMMFCGSSPKRKHASSPLMPPSDSSYKRINSDADHYEALPCHMVSSEPIYENLSSLMNNALFRSPPELPPKRSATKPAARLGKMVPPPPSEASTDTDVLSREDWPDRVPRPTGRNTLH